MHQTVTRVENIENKGDKKTRGISETRSREKLNISQPGANKEPWENQVRRKIARFSHAVEQADENQSLTPAPTNLKPPGDTFDFHFPVSAGFLHYKFG